MTILNFKEFMKKYIVKDNTINGSQLQKIYKHNTYSRDSKRYTDKGFVNIDDGSMGGSHWTCFIVKNNKSFYFDSFGGQPDKFLLNQ